MFDALTDGHAISPLLGPLNTTEIPGYFHGNFEIPQDFSLELFEYDV